MARLTQDDWHIITVALQTLRVQVMAAMDDTEESRQQTEEEVARIRTVIEKVAYVRRQQP